MKEFEFVPYECWEQDLDTVIADVAFRESGFIAARDRLRSAFKNPTCGKTLHHYEGRQLLRWKNIDERSPLTCNLPEGHDGIHAPDVDQEAWR